VLWGCLLGAVYWVLFILRHLRIFKKTQ